MKCPQCSSEFEPCRSTARFCSAKCRVYFSRAERRKTVLEEGGGQCAFAPDDCYEPGPDLELVDLGVPDFGYCQGTLLVLKGGVIACRRHKGKLGEERFKARFEFGLYHAIRRQQGAEVNGNAHFRSNVRGFMRGYRRKANTRSES